MVGIYKITSPENIVYIGQSMGIMRRFKSHMNLNKKGVQKNLYNSFFKYGTNSHIFEVIHEFKFNISRDILDEYERIYITRYKELGFNLFNRTSGGVASCKFDEDLKKELSENFPEAIKERYRNERSGELNQFYGKTHSVETRKIMSDKAKVRQRGANNTNASKILQYDSLMNFIAEYDTIIEAARLHGISRQSISACCSGRVPRAHGYIFKYAK